MRSQPRRQSDTSLKGFRSLSATASGAVRHSRARRAIEEIEKDKRGWLRNGLAALAISGLGLGVAGAVAVTGSAHEPNHGAASGGTISRSATGGQSSNRTAGTSRSSQRTELTGSQTGSRTDNRTSDQTGSRTGSRTSSQTAQKSDQPLDGTVDMTTRRDAQANAKVTDTTQQDSGAQSAADARAKALKSSFAKAEKLSSKLSKAQREKELSGAAKPATTTGTGSAGNYSVAGGDGQAHLPVNPGQYTIAATFGQVGSWARYHTGVDFAAPIGTPIHATANGVITNAGIGPASSWAGNYVVIKFSNGEQMLFAHMSSVAVSTGEQVSGGQLIGQIGMTGRAFGPHTHVELYPAGVTPGDVYSAVDPVPWFTAHGLHV